MKKLAVILFTSICLGLTAQEMPQGTYSGVLRAGLAKMRLRLNIGADGCSLDSPDQGATGLPLETDYLGADSIAVSSKALGAKYNATINGDTLKGKFSQRGLSFPLTLIKQEQAICRPQTPQAPYPYTSTDTVFSNQKAGITLAGTVVIPQGASKDTPVPAIVFVSGSGAQNRDEELFEHKPFLVIADYLARHGIASLRYDDRGFGQSGGDLTTGTTADFAEDALAAVKFLENFDAISKVGILGHSEGGTIAFMAASQYNLPYIVSLAGAIIPCKDILLEQNRQALAKAHLGVAQTNETLRLLDAAFDEMAKGNKPEINALATKLNINLPQALIANLAQNTKSTSPWFCYFLGLRPLDYVAKTTCPVFAIGGERDTQVNAAKNLEALKNARPDAETKIYPSLNHLFQHCTTGETNEYGEIEETISPEVLDDITVFITRCAKAR